MQHSHQTMHNRTMTVLPRRNQQRGSLRLLESWHVGRPKTILGTLAGAAVPLQCFLHSLLQLPEPEADELGRPTWLCTAQDVARAYRRMSVQVHPDKHPNNEEARTAFEALKSTHKLLTDRGSLVRL